MMMNPRYYKTRYFAEKMEVYASMNTALCCIFKGKKLDLIANLTYSFNVQNMKRATDIENRACMFV